MLHRKRQSSDLVTANDIVIRDIRNNEQNQLQFTMLVLGGGGSVLPADVVQVVIEVYIMLVKVIKCKDTQMICGAVLCRHLQRHT